FIRHKSSSRPLYAKRPPVFRRGPFLPCLLLREIRQSLHLLGSRPRTTVDVLALALKVIQNSARTVQHVRRDAADTEHTLERPTGDRNLLLSGGVLLGLHRVNVLNLLNVLLAERVVASLPVVNSNKNHFVLPGLSSSGFSGTPGRCGASGKGHSGVGSVHRVGGPAALPRIRSVASREDTDMPTPVPRFADRRALDMVEVEPVGIALEPLEGRAPLRNREVHCEPARVVRADIRRRHRAETRRAAPRSTLIGAVIPVRAVGSASVPGREDRRLLASGPVDGVDPEV